MMSVAHLRLGRLRPLWKPSVWIVRAVVPVLATIIVFGVPWMRGKYGDFVASAVWGLALLASYAGWGKLVGGRLYPNRKLGWGLECALGMGLSIAVGGALMLVHLARGPVIIGWTICGLAALLVAKVRAPVGPPRRHWLTALRRKSRLWHFAGCIVVFGALLLVRYLGSVANIEFNKWDDDIAYRGFARHILDSGTLLEPFSIHRIRSFCGQSYLHAMALVRAGPARLHLVDDGLCVLVVGGLVTGYEGVRRSTRIAILLALVVLVTLPHRPNDIESELSGVVFFLALFRILDSEGFALAQPRANAIVVALLAAAACTLRQSYIAACGAFLAFHYVSLFVANKAERRRWASEGCAVALATLALLTPWAALAYDSAKTFLYPVMRGTTNPAFALPGKVTVFEELRWIVENIFFCWPVRTIPIFAVGVLVLGYRAKTRALHALLFGMVVGFFSLVHFLRAFDLLDRLADHYFAFAVAFAIAVTLKAGQEPISRRRGITMAFALVAASVALQVIEVRAKTTELYNISLTNIEGEHTDRLRWNDMAWLRQDDLAQRMQTTVPAGARLLVMSDASFRFDGARNPLWNYEQPGAVSPRPGLPYFHGPEAMADYFKMNGVRYVAFMLTDSSHEYSLQKWRVHSNEADKPSGRGAQLKSQAKYYVDAFESLQKLATSRRVLFHEIDHWVLDLETPAASP